MLVEGSMAVERRLEEEMANTEQENDTLKKQIEEMSELLIKNYEDAELEAEGHMQMANLKSQIKEEPAPKEGPATDKGIHLDSVVDDTEDTLPIDTKVASTSTTPDAKDFTKEEQEALQKAIETVIHEATKTRSQLNGNKRCYNLWLLKRKTLHKSEKNGCN